MKTFTSCIFFMIALIGCTSAHNPQMQDRGAKMEMTNQEKAVAFIKSFETGNPDVMKFVKGDEFTSHNAYFPPGKETLMSIFTGKPTGTEVKTIRAFTDGDFVFLHNLYIGAEGYSGPIVTFDVMRFESGKIVEHWDNITYEATESVSGHTQLDGPTKATNQDKTAENKALVEEYVDTVLIKREFDKLGNYLNGEDVIQHNPMVDDGTSGIEVFLKQIQKDGTEFRHDRIHHVLGEGDFVLVMIEGQTAQKATSFYDLFRVEDGKIVELWDVIEEVLPKDKWTHKNGKY